VIGRWTVVNAVLAAIVLALGVQIARTWMRTLPSTGVRTSEDAAPDDAARRAGARAKRERQRDSKDVVAAIAAKDLFDPTRSGTASTDDATAAAPTEPLEPPAVVVVGVRLIGEDAEAVVEATDKGNEQRRIRAGDAIGDYTVQEIRESSVVLAAASGESVTLWLELGAGSATAPTPKPPAKPVAPPPAARANAPGQGGAARRAAQRAARRAARQRRARQGAAELPEGVRERLEALRRNR